MENYLTRQRSARHGELVTFQHFFTVSLSSYLWTAMRVSTSIRVGPTHALLLQQVFGFGRNR
jgi:hypothetical protein